MVAVRSSSNERQSDIVVKPWCCYVHKPMDMGFSGRSETMCASLRDSEVSLRILSVDFSCIESFSYLEMTIC